MAEHTVSTTTYTCDRCGATQQERPFQSRGKVRLTYDLHDYQGAAVAGHDETKDLCETCLGEVIKAVMER